MFKQDVPAVRLGKLAMVSMFTGAGLALIPFVGLIAAVVLIPLSLGLAVVAIIKAREHGTTSGPAPWAFFAPLIAPLALFVTLTGWTVCCVSFTASKTVKPKPVVLPHRP